MDPAGGVFGHRNARTKSPREVAQGFVDPPQFWEIAQPGNTVLVGPRGSGKTTLLKMLQSQGLEHWRSLDAPKARDLVTYSGVFISADQSWAGQVGMFSAQLDDRLRTSLGHACYTLHTLRALARCAAVRVKSSEVAHSHDRVEIERDREEKIVRETWKRWALREPVGSFAGLAESLSSLIAEIGELARDAIRHPTKVEILSAHPALNLEMVDAVVPFIERFNNAADQEAHVWAFLIDEIEFLPPGIAAMILGAMRGRDPRLIRKISLAPYTRVAVELAGSPLGGWEGHDFETVDLTFEEKEDGYPFSRALIKKELEGLSLKLTPEELLGKGGFFENAPGKDAYLPGSTNAKAIKALARKDPTFREWLSHHKIDSKRPDKTIGTRRASTLRKAMPIILLRDTYLHRVRGELQERTRKAPRTYVGELSAFAICENNPRLLQTLVSRLLANSSGRRPSDGVRVEVINKISKQFSLHLRNIEVPDAAPPALMPLPLVETIGHRFRASVLGPEFNPEPPLSFTFTPDPKDVLLTQVLSQLVFYGAVILARDRLRLAHTFAPLFELPLRKGRKVSLQRIVGEGKSGQIGQLEIAEAHGEED